MSVAQSDRVRQDRTFNGVGVSGWAGMAHAFRTIDEERIRDCKEDIDTLLVFAGLFSAVLTAFLIESYSSLAPDKTDAVIALLSQISSQTSSYTLTAQMLNSTVIPSPSTTSSEFEPATSALRVNILWFASLNISLITASFGIMVKQWLRSYLAMTYFSPQARLRARRFRLPGLEKWKVLEIAAILPLLLQLALGLFLVGLCFFTWSVHPSVGKTSVPLVTGWAFMFFSAVIAPAFSARCPYKTILLERALKSLRCFVRRQKVPQIISDYLCRLELCIPFTILTQHSSTLNLSQISPCAEEEKASILEEEEDAIKDEGSDIQFLAQTDEIMQDDELLVSSILDSVRQLALDASDTTQFLLRCLKHRIKQRNVGGTQWTEFLDLSRLTKRCWTALTDAAAETIIQYLSLPKSSHTLPEEYSWFDDAIMMLFSVSSYPLTEQGERAITLILKNLDACKRLNRIASRFPADSRALPHCMNRLRQTVSLFSDDGKLSTAAMLNILQSWFCMDSCTHKRSIHATFIVHAGTISAEVLNGFYGMAISAVRQVEKLPNWPNHHLECLRVLLSSGLEMAAVRTETIQVLTAVYTSWQECYSPIGMFTSADDNAYAMPRAEGEKEFNAIRMLFLAQSMSVRAQYVTNMARICREITSGQFYNPTKQFTLINVVRLCWLSLWLYEADLSTHSCCAEWTDMWEQLPVAMHKFRTQKYDENANGGREKQTMASLALICLSKLQTYDNPKMEENVSYEQWLEAFDPDKTIFPDQLYKELAWFTDNTVSSSIYRLMHLRATQTALPLSSTAETTAGVARIEPAESEFDANTAGRGSDSSQPEVVE